MRLRSWVTLITLALLTLMVALGWSEIARAWQLLGTVDLRILALMVPVQILSYWVTGEVMFTYLRSKGDLVKAPWWLTPRIALELNFVHHVMPSAGVAGFSFLGWALSRYGVSVGRTTMAQIIQVTLTFVSYTLILILAVVALVFDREINRTIIATSAALVAVVVASVVLLIHVTGDRKRLETAAGWATRTVNAVVYALTLHRKVEVLKPERVRGFFDEIHRDYLEIRDERRLLLRPFLLSAVANCLDISLFYLAFRSLGIHVDPGVMVIAFGLSSILGMVSVTPGGSGVYETAMIMLLTAAGVSSQAAIAGTLLARVVLLVSTIAFGYVFYQLRVGYSPAAASDGADVTG